MIPIIVFVVTVLLNLYIIIFGKKDLEALKNKVNLKTYLAEINKILDESLGKKWADGLKAGLFVIALGFLIINLVLAGMCIIAVALGVYAAKKLYQIPSVQNLLNKFATYINRIKQ